MADEQDNSPIAAAEPESGEAGSRQASAPKRPKVISFSGPFFGNSSVNGITVNDKPVGPNNSVRLNPGDKISIFGKGLAEFTKWVFSEKGSAGKRLEVPKVIGADGGVVFSAADWRYYFGPKDATALIFKEKDSPQAWALPVVFYFGSEEEKEEGKTAGKGARGKESVGTGRETGGPSGGISALVEAGGEVLGGAVSPFVSKTGAAAKRNELKEALRSGDNKRVSSLVNELKASGDVAGLREAAAVSGTAHLKSINDAIYETGQTRINASQTASEIDEIISSINVDDIDEETEISGGQEIGGTVTIDQEARTQGSGTAQVTGEVTATGEAGAEAFPVGGGVAGGGGAAEISAKAERGAGAPIAAPNGELKRSAEIVGEHIDKNPQLLNQIGVRGKVLTALAEGRPESLQGEEQAGLMKALETIQATGGLSAELKTAAEVLSGGKSAPKEQSGAAKAPASEKFSIDKVTAADTSRGEVIAKAVAEGVVDISGGAGSGNGVKQRSPKAQTGADGGGFSEEAGAVEDGAPSGPKRASGAGSTRRPRDTDWAAEVDAERKAELEELRRHDSDLLRSVPGLVARGEYGLPAEEEKQGKEPDEEDGVAEEESFGKGKTSKKEPKVPSAAKPRVRAPVDSAASKEAGKPQEALGGSDGGQGRKAQGGDQDGLGPDVGAPLSSEELAKGVEEDKEKEPKNKDDDLGKTDFDHKLPEEQTKEDVNREAQEPVEAPEPIAAAYDTTIDKVVSLINKEINAFLSRIALWVWGTAIPSFGLSILLGAIVGDLLVFMKNFLVKRAIGVLSVASLGQGIKIAKFSPEEIAQKIKIGIGVKIHVLAMNLVVLLAALLIFMFFAAFVWWACQDWGLRGALYLTGHQDVCKMLSANFPTGDGGFGGAGVDRGVSGTGQCKPVAYGPASVSALSNTCFSTVAVQASSIANVESHGDIDIPSGVDKCALDGKAVSWGLFQINLTVHELNGLDCPGAFEGGPYTSRNHNCRVINQPLYDACVRAASDPQINIAKACEIYNSAGNWSPWGANRICGF